MKWVVIAVGLLVVLVLLVVVIGYLLPKHHTASKTARLKRPPQEVWEVVRDLAGADAWWPAVKKAERLSDRDGREVYRQTLKNGPPLTMEVVESDPPRRLVTRIVDENLPFGGTWTYEIEPAEGGSRITVTEDGEVYNPVFRFMSRFVFGYTATMESYLKALGARFGEEVQFE
jgi:uncharacterized protein YndB with AHSA1/START domain